MSRAAMLTTGAVVALAGCESSTAFYGACSPPPDTIDLDVPCMFDVESTCSNTPTDCNATTSCRIGPITADCSISVTLASNGAQTTFAVTVDQVTENLGFCKDQTFTEITSPTPDITCPLLFPDAGFDASTISDAASEAESGE
jgi:hypothetical protein